MKRNRITNLKVGITVIVSIFILLYGIAFLKDFKINLATNDVIVYFSDVNGLKEGDPVSVNGVPRGKVRTIELEGDSVKVTFYVSKDVVFHKDCSISVAMIELMSGKQVSIKPGKSPELADMNKPFIGDKANDVITLIQTMNNVGDQVKSISNSIEKTADELNVVVKNINDIVGDPKMKSDIKGATGNFNTASRSLVALLEENRTNLKSLTTKLNTIADNVDNTVTSSQPDIKQTFSDIRDLTTKLDSAASNLNNFILSTRDSSSTVGKLMTDDQLYTNLNKAIISLDKLIKQIKEKGIKLRIF